MSVQYLLKRHLVLSTLICFLGLGSLCSCAQIGSSAGDEGTVDVATSPAPEAPSITYEFPDLPLPVELKRINDKSIMIHYPNYQGGILVLKGRVTVDSIVDFFTKNMPKYGWELTGTLSAKRTLMGFSKAGNAYCLVVVSEERMGFQTEVQIWLSEPLGD